MFLREALLRCSQLEDEVATVYARLAASGSMPEAAVQWEELANKEKSRARLLQALAELASALDDDGPFLVQVPVQLANLRRVLDSVRERIASAIDGATAVRCAAALEGTQRAELHASLLEISEPGIRRLLRVIDAETKGMRRAGLEVARSRSVVRTRDSARNRAACSQPVN